MLLSTTNSSNYYYSSLEVNHCCLPLPAATQYIHEAALQPITADISADIRALDHPYCHCGGINITYVRDRVRWKRENVIHFTGPANNSNSNSCLQHFLSFQRLIIHCTIAEQRPYIQPSVSQIKLKF